MEEHSGMDDLLGAAAGVDSGTTIMAVTYEGGVILGADSRTSTGAYVANRVSDKLTQITDRVYVCRSGSAADTQALADYVRRFASEHAVDKGSPPTVGTIAKLFRTLCYGNKDRLLAGVIIGGYDDADGPSVWEIPLGGTAMKLPYAVGGSGSTYIYGLLDAMYRPGMSKSECVDFVTRCISHAMARDGSSGGVIRLVVIDKDGVTRRFVPGDRLPYMLSGAPGVPIAEAAVTV